MTTIAAWTAFAEKLHKVGLDIFATAAVPVTYKGFSDEKVLALTLLARTNSNLKAALLLLREKHIVEARTITRCCYENLYWVVRLLDDGHAFVRKMVDDEMTHRKNRGEFIFENGLTLETDVEARLRAFLKDANKQFAAAKTLHPKQVAGKSVVGTSYLVYGQLSSDAAHPSVTALNRYVVPHTQDDVGGIDVNPIVKDEEIEQTLEFLCLAAMHVCVAVNQMIGGTEGGKALNGLADEFVEHRDTSAKERSRRKGKATERLDV
jgi:hypothetical protein